MKEKKNNKAKIRVEFKKKYQGRNRHGDVTRDYLHNEEGQSDAVSSERVSGKGRLTRHRTVIVDQDSGETQADGVMGQLDVTDSATMSGRVLEIYGLKSLVMADDGRLFRCATRGLLKTLSTDQRHVVAAGDRVRFRIEHGSEGVILRVEPRRGILSRTSRGRQHVIVVNVDQVLVVASAAQPSIKPNLIDRFLVTAERNGLEPVICINKVDLIDSSELQPLVGVYSQLGYRVVLTSAERGWGIEQLRDIVRGQQSVVAGQSGVGKSSLLNAMDPGWKLRVQTVSQENEKGRHTTTTAKLIPLPTGGFLVDTPGIRQFQLWDVEPNEVGGYFRDLRPFANYCRFPNCSHIHEVGCAVKNAVADNRIDARRYESYSHLIEDRPERGEGDEDF